MLEKILLYGHGGAYNHGAEAIIKTTVRGLRESGFNQKILLSTHFREQDEEYHMPVDEYLERNMDYVLREKKENTLGYYNQQIYASTLSTIDRRTLGLSVGGDNFCYPAWHRWRTIHNSFKKHGAKDVLWSCSIDGTYLSDEMIETLASYDLITVRESASYQLLEATGLKNLKRCADVAFLLKPEYMKLPDGFEENNTVAINVSPLVIRKENERDIILKNIYELIDAIIETTDMQILLISHVTMPMDNDEDVVKEIYEHYKILNMRKRIVKCSSDLTAAQRKYIISKCRFVVAARTHASIAAYSMNVPVLALGYSIKASGIAKDMEMEKFLLPIEQINKSEIVRERFFEMLCIEEMLKKKLAERNVIMKDLACRNFESLKNVVNEG